MSQCSLFINGLIVMALEGYDVIFFSVFSLYLAFCYSLFSFYCHCFVNLQTGIRKYSTSILTPPPLLTKQISKKKERRKERKKETKRKKERKKKKERYGKR